MAIFIEQTKFIPRYLIALILAWQCLLLPVILNNSKFIDSINWAIILFILIPASSAIVLGILRKKYGTIIDKLFISIIVSGLISIIGLSVLYSLSFIGQILIVLVVVIISISISGTILKLLGKTKKYSILTYGLIAIFFIGGFNVVFPVLKHYYQVNETKVLLFGVDGADWNIIEELVGAGELFHFSKVIRGGCRGDLIAEEPLLSPILWTTIASGRPPAEHGLYGYLTSLNASMIKCRRIWDIVEEYGMSCGAVQYLGLYPLGDSPSGFAIPSYYEEGIQARPERLIFIASFANKIRRGEINPGNFLHFIYNSTVNGMRLSTAVYLLDTACRLFTDIDIGKVEYVKFRLFVFFDRLYQDVFLHVNCKSPAALVLYYFPITDVAGHLYFRDYKPNFLNLDSSQVSKTANDFIPEVYREADRALSRFLEEFDENTSIFIVSDHGMIPTPSDTPGGQLLFDSDKKFNEYLGCDDVEYIQGGKKLYFTPSENSDLSYEKIIGLLKSIRYEDPPVPFGKACFIDGYGVKQEEIPENAEKGFIEYEFYAIEDSLMKSLIEFPTGLYPLGEFTAKPEDYFISGMHSSRGIFIAYGKNLRSNYNAGELKHTDLLPIIMSALGLPTAEDMPGHVPHIFHVKYQRNLPAAVATYNTIPWAEIPAPPADSLEIVKGALEQQFKALGYIE